MTQQLFIVDNCTDIYKGASIATGEKGETIISCNVPQSVIVMK